MFLRFSGIKYALVICLLIAAARYAPASDDSWTSPDKQLHFGASFVLASAGYLAARGLLDWRKPQALAAAAGTTLAIGVGKELTDAHFDIKDMAWNAAGVAAASGLWYLLDREPPPVQMVITPERAFCMYIRSF